MRVDLHTHTTASDGSLSPGALLAQAAAAEVELLAITDHDTVAAYQSLPSTTTPTMVSGIEWSTNWAGTGIHMLGLGFDLRSAVLLQGVAQQSAARSRRGRRIAAKLLRLTGQDLWPRASALAGDGVIGRPHFAAALIEAGLVKDWGQAFGRYLGRDKPGDIKTDWASMDELIKLTRTAGGIAVLAHPLHYRLTHRKLRLLLDDFAAAGGQAIEVVSGSQTKEQTDYLARLAKERDLLASCGSDFHRPSNWSAPGAVAPLPASCEPIWERWL